MQEVYIDEISYTLVYDIYNHIKVLWVIQFYDFFTYKGQRWRKQDNLV